MKTKSNLEIGDYGYLDAYKKCQLIRLVAWIIVITAVIIGGWLYFGTRANIVTVIGVILVIPAAKTVIAYIVVFRYHSGERKDYETIQTMAGQNSLILADLVLTKYEGSMCLTIAVIHSGNVFAYVRPQKTSTDKIRAYLQESVKAAGGEAHPFVYTDFNKYCEFIKKIGQSKISVSRADQRIAEDLICKSVK